MPDSHPPADSSTAHAQSVSLRAALIGLLLSAVVSLWGQFAADQLGYNFMTFTQLPSCLLLPFLLLVLGPNLPVRILAPKWALTSSEMLTIFCMGLIASMVPDWAMTRYLMGMITAPHYFASPENQWADKFFAYLPQWLVLQDDQGAATAFFEGLSPSQPIPWSAWVVPLFWWLSLLGTLLLVGACLVVILRKQWVEYERLRFPLGEVALHLIETQPDGEKKASLATGLPLLFRTRMFQVGFAFVFFMMAWNCGSYWGIWARIPIAGPDVFNLVIERAFPGIPIRLNLYSLCFAFFVNVEILFSVWFFQLFGIIQQGVLNRIGILSTSSTIVPGGLVSIQFIGGMIVFALWGLWMARYHLRSVVRQAFRPAAEPYDGDELFSYRSAVIGLVLGFVFILFWLHRVGFSFPVAILFLFFLFVFYLATARVVAEAGLVMLDLPINAHQFTVGMVGSANLGHSTLTGLGLSNAFARNWRTFTMIGLSHVAWLREHIWPDRRHLFRWICLAFAVSTLSSFTYIIYAGYTQGAQNLRTNPGGTGVGFYNLIIQWINNATQITDLEVIFLLSGVALNLLLTAGRYLFYWWPLHPIGFVVGASGPVRNAVFPIFLAWLIQSLLLRFGGVRLYRKVQPLFLGMLVGYVFGVILSYLVDTIWFPDMPHAIEAF